MKNELSELQQQELSILKEFQSICHKYGLKYFVVAGSMLGAIRHNGFIPWDDDIDVAMPRKDYDRFLKIAPSELSSSLYLSTPREKSHILIVTNIISRKGGFVLNNAEKKIHTGAWIDIMVIDGVPKPGLKRSLHWYRYLCLRALFQMSHFNEVVDQKRKRPFVERIIIKIAKVTRMQRILNPVKINNRMEKLLRSVPYGTSQFAATYCGIYRKKEIVPRKWYGKGCRYVFEDTYVNGLSNADKYLKQLYGDYMKIPKKEDIREHNVTEEKNEIVNS